MEQQIFFKSVELANSDTAFIKTKWKPEDDEVKISIFLPKSSAVYIGAFSVDSLKKKDDSIPFEAIKSSITVPEKLNDISYELDTKRQRFIVVKQESGGSQDSVGDIIYLKVGVKLLQPADAMQFVLQLVTDMLEVQKQMNKQNATIETYRNDFKEIQQRQEALEAEKSENDKKLFPSFVSLLNSKKKRIVELERQIQKLKNSSSKFANLSSDLEVSDLSLKESKTFSKSPKKSTPVKRIQTKIFSSQSSDENESKPSTSKASCISPVKSDPTGSPRRQLRRTPSGSTQFQRNSLFRFESLQESDDSLDQLDKPKPRSQRAPKPKTVLFKEQDILTGLSAKLKSKFLLDSDNQSSAELLTSKVIGKSKEDSTSSKSSYTSCRKSSTPEQHLEPAQLMDFEGDFDEENSKESQEKFKESQYILTQRLEEDEEVPNSQSSESPSIFSSFPKRKSLNSPVDSFINKRTKITINKSKFSLDTIDILAQESQ